MAAAIEDLAAARRAAFQGVIDTVALGDGSTSFDKDINWSNTHSDGWDDRN